MGCIPPNCCEQQTAKTFNKFLEEKGLLVSGQRVEDLTAQIDDLKKDPEFKSFLKSGLPTPYAMEFTWSRKIRGIIAFALVTAALSVYILSLTSGLNIGQKIVDAFKNINPKNLAIGAVTTAILLGGSGYVMYLAMTKKDPLIDNADIGKMHGSSHVKEVIFFGVGEKKDGSHTAIVKEPEWAYLDTSTLRDPKNGKAYLYGVKDLPSHYQVSGTVTLTSLPVYLTGVILTDIIRLVAAPFYILGSIIFNGGRGYKQEAKDNERTFKLIDIPIVIGTSLKRIVTAPFFAIAYFFAAFYSLFDPFNGRKWANKIEWLWNKGVSRAEGFWSVRGPQALWPGWSYHFSPEGIHANGGYYFAGCWAPVGLVTIEDGVITAVSMSKAITDDHKAQVNKEQEEDEEFLVEGYTYHVFTREVLASTG